MPIYDKNVTLNLPHEIKRAYLAPQMTPLAFTQTEGCISYTVDKIDCHQMIVLQY